MRRRRLGKSGPEVSAVGLGHGAVAPRPGEPLEAEFRAAVARALELGVDFFDTSDAAWHGRHEALLGQALRAAAGRAFLATKFGNLESPDGRRGVNGRPEYVAQACEASLRRLGMETIGLYYLHRVDPAVPIEDTVGAMARLVEQGKVRFLGLCEASAPQLRRAHAVHPIAALQMEYSLWYRRPEQELLPACRELGVAFVAYAPLGRGLLTGTIKSADDFAPEDRRRRHPRFQPESLRRNLELVAALEARASRAGATPAQLALAWLLAQGEDVLPIPGTNRARNVEENAAACELALPGEAARALSELFPVGAGAGERYPRALLDAWGLAD